MKLNRSIIFYTPTYPDVMTSFFCALSATNRIVVVCCGAICDERKKIYSNGFENKCEVLQLKDYATIESFFSMNREMVQNSVNVFCGVTGIVLDVLKFFITFTNKDKCLYVVMEKPSVVPVEFFPKTIKLLKLTYSSYIYKKAFKLIQSKLGGVFVTGQRGVDQLISYEVPANKVFNFLYTHIDEEIEEAEKSKPVDTIKQGDIVKFVYVGRFDLLNRELDHLIRAFDKLDSNDWTLDLVGGYGKDSQKIIAWANNKENVNYLGAWSSDTVINNLRKYDVCLCPSRIDGWRIQVNQAILAGIGVIASSETISNEMLDYSDSGFSYNPNDRNGLYNCILKVVKNKEIISKWKRNAEKYAPKISNGVVAQYFISVVDSIEAQSLERPAIPWRDE